jgi:tetratricopeptide (TPR) repeat protein
MQSSQRSASGADRDAPRSQTPEHDALRHFRGDAVEGAVMRSSIRGRLFGDDGPPLPRIGPLVLHKLVGRGGMGVVFAAYDRRLRREVAVKLIALDRRPEAAGILDEARAIAAIDHENVVRVFSAGRCSIPGEEHPRVYIAMERVRGQTLRRWVTRHSPSHQAIIDAYCQAARGLGAAHRAGITHGDFKPDNAMIDEDGRVRAMDFGLAVRREPVTFADAVTTTSERIAEVAGTPGYMAPELYAGDRPDPRSDQWALCASLYEALVGVLPDRVPDERLQRRHETRAGLELRVAAVLWHGLGPDPRQRYPTMDALADALVSTRPRNRGIVVVGALALLGLGALALPGGATRCEDAARMASTWGDTQRAALRHAVADSGIDPAISQPDAIIGALDEYADELSRAMTAECAADEPGAHEAPAVDLRRGCLERHRRSFAAIVDGLQDPSAHRLANVRAAIDRLPDPPQCLQANELARWMPRDPALAREVEHVRDDLAAAAVAAELGERGTAPFFALRQRARALDHAPLVAEVEVEMARHEKVMGDPALAAGMLEHAHAIAVEHGMDALAASGAIERALLAVLVDGDVDSAKRWLRAAESAATAADDVTAEARLLDVEYEIAIAENHLDLAVDLAHRSLERAETRCPDGCVDTIVALHELAQASWYLGRLGEALQHGDRARTLSIERLGALHELTLELAQLRANVLAELGDNAEAATQLEQLIATRIVTAAPASPLVVSTRFALASALSGLPERVRDAEHEYERVIADAERAGNDHFVGMATAALGSIYFRRGEHVRALEADRRAIEILQRVHGPEHPQIATLLNNHGVHLAEVGDIAGALAASQRGWAIWKAATPEQSPQDAAFLHGIGARLLALGRAPEAIPLLEQALAATRVDPITGPGIAARAVLVDALVMTGRTDDARALLVESQRRCAALQGERRVAAKCELLERTALD